MRNFWGRCILGAPSRQLPCAWLPSTRGAPDPRCFGLARECRPRRLSAHGVGPDGRRPRAQIKPFGVGRMTARAIRAVPGRASRDGLGSWRSRGDAYGQWSQFTQQSQDASTRKLDVFRLCQLLVALLEPLATAWASMDSKSNTLEQPIHLAVLRESSGAASSPNERAAIAGLAFAVAVPG
jgi:hypothetical protein